MLSFWKAAALGLTGYVLGSAMVIVIAQMHKDSWLSGGIIAAMSLPVAAIQFVFLALIVALFGWLDRAFGAVAN